LKERFKEEILSHYSFMIGTGLYLAKNSEGKEVKTDLMTLAIVMYLLPATNFRISVRSLSWLLKRDAKTDNRPVCLI